MLGAMADEPVRIRNYLEAADTRSTLAAVQALGALVEERGAGLVIRGTGLREAREPDGVLDVGNAGTLLRLLPGWLAAQEGRAFTLDGDASIRRRPVDRVTAPLALMGAQIAAREGRFAPFTVTGARLHGIELRAPRRQRAGEVVRAVRRARGRRPDDDRRARAAAAITPSACSAPPACGCSARATR